MQPPGPGIIPNWSQQGFERQTLRQVVRVSAGGDHTADVGGEAFTDTSRSWYFLAGVRVRCAADCRGDGVVASGDSITDGFGSTVDAGNRYPDELAEHFVRSGRPRSVLNHGPSDAGYRAMAEAVGTAL